MKPHQLLTLAATIVLAACCSTTSKENINTVFKWKASWIGTGEDEYPDSVYSAPAPCFRKEFRADGKVVHAQLNVCGLGFYEMYINGEKVGDKVLTPPVTNFDKRGLYRAIYFYDDQSTTRCLFDSYDVTDMVRKGSNAIGIVLGNGWYNQRSRVGEGTMWYDTPRAIAQLDLTYRDGSVVSIVTDRTWKWAEGGLLSDAIFTGEVFDARKEPKGWDKVGFDDSSWTPATLVRKPDGDLEPNLIPADKVIRRLEVSVDSVARDSVYYLSIPETVAGWAVLNVSGRAGSRISLRFISEEGLDYGQTDTYILDGRGRETWHPRFTWHAFRHIEVTSPDVRITPRDIFVEEVRTDVPQTGRFECSNELFNEIHDAYIRTQNANLHGGISSDCPHRERLAYTGDGQVGAPAALFTYDMRAVYRKWFEDMEDARNHVTGYVPHTAPYAGGGGGPAWGSAIVIMPWLYYVHYGDKNILERHYKAMKEWVAYLATRTDNRGIVVREEPNGWCLGDWCTPDAIELPEPLVNTAYWFHCSDLLSKIAGILGNKEDAVYYRSLCNRIRTSFNKAFYNPATGHYWEGRQGSDVIPLQFGMTADSIQRSKVMAGMLEHLEDLDWHFDTGILATPMVLDVLTAEGMADLAGKVLDQRTYPSYSYLLDGYSTTLWERWNGNDSRCHPMFGSVVEWLYSSLAGIDIERSDIAAGKVRIEPHTAGLTYCTATYESIYGPVSTSWKVEGGKTTLKVDIPDGVTAEVHFAGKVHEIESSAEFSE